MNPFQPWRSAFDFWAMMAQAQTVIALRTMGMMGVLPAAAGENATMFSEKGPAFAEAAMAAGVAALQGRSPDQIAQAAIRPIARRTGSNVRRLTKPRR
ncbi:antifreeze protein [Rubellimicrobium roseum]|uniref:Antifreeze protein n=1 Tax=Rubellimicrobium roseum TaxID=687525 RepID=A0A5C4NAR8_9RHOB|nr:antifreeze protein [Rubellimicrobium roseum]TNC65975.1 antifreeze protein [Rubellimicrobium roseum]